MQLDFLDQVKGFKKEELDDKKIEMIKPYLAKSLFDPVKLMSINKIASSFAAWVIAMESFY